ncbi:HNH endonuclease [Bacillus aquiflavi]|uniref:HNH endonuclease n=1 Tax=Bacillus aquiflavi TaxID=2672567 RepID=A0A6B3W3S0_9BACI|nr:HNH endonuclease [Bacillus aquiflavi]MBA4538274.1 HNH endonuclease [Bacillus aquiflavi]NEY82593.1 hypothetical protein [Bacillus aquiflavi]UAC48149.1 HNH endonuclease [Bacillus aquiflavi]
MNAERLKHLKKHIHLLEIDIERGLILNKKQFLGNRGYYCIYLSGKLYKVHQIIAVAAGLDILDKTINHINCNKLDNRIENLEVVSLSENVSHAHKNGLHEHLIGNNHHKAKLTEKDVKQIRRLLNEGKMLKAEIARKYDVSFKLITKIQQNKIWKHV